MERNNIEFLSPVEIKINRDRNFKLITKKNNQKNDEYLLAQKRREERDFYAAFLGDNFTDHEYIV